MITYIINNMTAFCIHVNCKSQPNFNIPSEKQGIYCKKHKLTGMINVFANICIHENCQTQSLYNIPSVKKGLYCKKHKLTGMINVFANICIHENCQNCSYFNMKTEKKGLYCKDHKLTGMIDVIHKKCIHDNCQTTPKFNMKTEKKGLYCNVHKLTGMINVMAKKCIHDNCQTHPKFNMKTEKIGLYCNVHKLTGMINVIHKRCKTNLCDIITKNKYEGYCLFCFINTFPDKPVSRNYKTKEKNVVDNIQKSFPDFTWVADKKIANGCSRKRPDLLLDLGSHIIIVEIDENQHTNYDCSCENKRLMELSQDVGHRPIVFIRFNPDDYIENGKKITSCWSLTKQGILTVNKNKEKEWLERIKVLENQIQYWVDNSTNKMIEVIQLFY